MNTAVQPIPDSHMRHDWRTLVHFIEIYCHDLHDQADARLVQLKTHDVTAIAGHQVKLCPACIRLLTHALVKRTTCPMHPKPACKHCPSHCYHPNYRAQIREVMKYSGKKMVLHGRVDLLMRLLF